MPRLVPQLGMVWCCLSTLGFIVNCFAALLFTYLAPGLFQEIAQWVAWRHVNPQVLNGNSVKNAFIVPDFAGDNA